MLNLFYPTRFYQNQSKTTVDEYAVVQSITAASVVDCGDDPVRYLWAAIEERVGW